jgi:hypothetical protein
MQRELWNFGRLSTSKEIRTSTTYKNVSLTMHCTNSADRVECAPILARRLVKIASLGSLTV